MKDYLFIGVLMLAVFGLIWLAFNRLPATAYNAHMCATYGYEPDCKTSLK